VVIRTPEISSIETAIRLYWEKIELSTKDIKELFHPVGNKKVVLLKETAKEKMAENQTPSWNALRVNTKTAYEAWGLDIDDLERRYNKLQKLGLKNEESQCPN
jgi:hypothetical protein